MIFRKIYIVRIHFKSGKSIKVAALKLDLKFGLDELTSVDYHFRRYRNIGKPLYINWKEVVAVQELKTKYQFVWGG